MQGHQRNNKSCPNFEQEIGICLEEYFENLDETEESIFRNMGFSFIFDDTEQEEAAEFYNF